MPKPRTWLSYGIHSLLWDAIIHVCPNFIAIEVKACMGNYIPLFYIDLAMLKPSTWLSKAKQVSLNSIIRPVSQIRGPWGGCREPVGGDDKTTWTAVCFEHKTQYLLIRAPYTRIVVFWHISNIPPWFRRVKLEYRNGLYSSNICEILLYKGQLLVITHELI